MSCVFAHPLRPSACRRACWPVRHHRTRFPPSSPWSWRWIRWSASPLRCSPTTKTPSSTASSPRAPLSGQSYIHSGWGFQPSYRFIHHICTVASAAFQKWFGYHSLSTSARLISFKLDLFSVSSPRRREHGRGKRGRVWLRISANEQRQINASLLQREEMSRRWRVAKLLTLTAGPSRWGSTMSTLSDADAYIRSHPPHCSGGCTVAAHGFFLQSGLQPQMVLTTGQDEEVFHVVSTARVSCPKWWQSELSSSFGLAIKTPINGLDPEKYFSSGTFWGSFWALHFTLHLIYEHAFIWQDLQ